MTSSSHLLHLYPSILVSGMEFLSVHDLGALDMATVNRKLRPVFLKMLHYCKVTLSHSDKDGYYCHMHKCEWILMRGISVSHVQFDHPLTALERRVLLQQKDLKRIESTYQAYSAAIQLNSCIREIKITEELRDSDFASSLAKVEKVESIDISDCSYYTSDISYAVPNRVQGSSFL